MNELNAILKEVSSLERRVFELKANLRHHYFKDDIPEGQLSLLLTEVSGQNVGIPLSHVDEVLQMCALNTCPEAPPWVPGLLNLRGNMIPVIDLNARVSRTARKAAVEDFIVICKKKTLHFGLLVQQVNSIVQPDSGEIKKSSVEISLAPYVMGFFQHKGRSVYILSLSCLVETSMLPEGIA
ncbi:MAG: chemotaxis protein CheW [Deltaproteobacteria bacterium]|nr:chemotaxis protein CheW [Deltaproteobacteria bacterium]